MLESSQQKGQSLAQQVASKMEEFIKEQRYKAGDKLPNEFELATELNVGRGTIREAIKLLAARNVVIIQRGKGTFVSENPGLTEDPLGLSFITDKKRLSHDLMDVRVMIEPEIAKLAAEHATPAEVEEMEAICLVIEKLIHENKNHEEKDIQLHSAIAKASKNVVVPSLIPIIQTAISLFINLTNRSLKEETIETHRQIVEAIKIKDGEAAKKAMQRHLGYNKDELKI
ncbi:FadR/GntR family transcriptional regulator [Carnobacterium divergens]|uniref:GntR family transcriptional regulator n=1 Tax=Carnobacterium divergens TaxID=2748 RepID=A0A7Z8D030_CARDV|nr:FadR/GntR family transcriptional regulator [Carnobacterium divergens]TFI73558.1 GntR family transcriptional regulator [Carnobacterium divergens]TFI77505.1 GntR family transcriptional regulator [Carnobacterium divergens]TFI84268.1 GntR family transcriptional regulator [Carnobacterium divergens]TFI96115.1 GntR family transcriptional regulator [Carnobacterium divergens]TFJ12418.1 GntR family transcriptional regulator [Carnobacterium divergens]